MQKASGTFSFYEMVQQVLEQMWCFFTLKQFEERVKEIYGIGKSDGCPTYKTALQV